MALLGDAAADGGGGGTTDSVSAAAESKPRCDSRPYESPLPETTVSNGGYIPYIMISVTTMTLLTGLPTDIQPHTGQLFITTRLNALS